MTEDEDNSDQSWIEETFGGRLEDTDVTLDKLESEYDEKLEEYGDERLARTAVQAEFNSLVNTGADTEIQMITIGGDDDPFNNGEVFIGYALCIPESDPVKLASVRFERGDVDVPAIQDYFYDPFTPVGGEFNIRDAEKPIGNNAYRVSAAKGTQVEEVDSDKPREERKGMVDDFVGEAEIANIGSHLSLTNENGYAAEFGVDLKKITGAYVHEVRVGDSATRLVVQDDSFVDARDLGDDVRGEDNEAGLVCWADSGAVDFGEGSIADLYGAITPNQDGHVTMNLVGADPIRATELQTGDDGSSAEEEEASSGPSTGATEQRQI